MSLYSFFCVYFIKYLKPILPEQKLILNLQIIHHFKILKWCLGKINFRLKMDLKLFKNRNKYQLLKYYNILSRLPC